MKRLYTILFLASTFAYSQDSREFLEDLLAKADVQVEQSKFRKALSTLEKADIEAIRLGDDDEHLSILSEMSKLHFNLGQYEEAYIMQKTFVSASSDTTAEDYLDLALFAGFAQHRQQSLEYLARVQKTYKKRSAKMSIRLLRVKAKVDLRTGFPKLAVKNLHLLHGFLKSNKDLKASVLTLIEIGNVYQDHLADYKKAAVQYALAKREAAAIKFREGVLKAEIDLANVYIKTSRISEGIALLGVVSKSLDQDKERMTYIRAQQILANAFYRKANFQKSKTISQSIISNLANSGSDPKWVRAKIEAGNLLGLSLASQGFIESGVKQLNSVVEVARKFSARKEEAYVLNNLGFWHRENGELRTAVKLLKQAVRIDREIGNEEGLAFDLRNLGLTYLKERKVELAEATLTKSRDMSESQGIYYNILKANIGLAQVAELKGQWSKAVDIYQKVLNSEATIYFSMERWQSQSALARLLIKLKENDSASKHFAAAVQTIEKIQGLANDPLVRKKFKTSEEVKNTFSDYVDFLVMNGESEKAKTVNLRWQNL